MLRIFQDLIGYRTTALAITAVALLSTQEATAQAYPNKPITLVSPYSAGATLDMISRKMAEEMSATLGQRIIVDNRPGADGQIGMEYVANRVAPDGYTFMITSVPAMALLPLTVRKLQFDPLNDFTLFLGIGESRYVFGSSSIEPWTSVEELKAYAKANPKKVLYGASNPAVRFWADELVRTLGFEATGVPYKEGGVYINALGTGEVSMGFLAEVSALSLGDRFRILATTGVARLAEFPNVPTFGELNMPQMRGTLYAFAVPRNTPSEVVTILHKAASDVLNRPDVREAFAKFRIEVMNLSQDRVESELQEQHIMFSKMAMQAGLEPQ